jgi:hypothetical protein
METRRRWTVLRLLLVRSLLVVRRLVGSLVVVLLRLLLVRGLVVVLRGLLLRLPVVRRLAGQGRLGGGVAH